LEVVFVPFILPINIEKQILIVKINDTFTKECILTEQGSKKINILIPNEWLKGPKLIIDFELPNAISPKKLGISEDSRELGIALQSLTLSEMNCNSRKR